MKREPQPLDFLVDDLTNSIKNRISGDSFQTEVANLTKQDLKSVTKGAYRFGGHKMIISTEAAQKLVDYYFKN